MRNVLRDNPHRGADHLYVAARRDGIEVTKRQLDAFLKEPRSDRAAETDEIFADRVTYQGKSAAEGPGQRWQADLAIYGRSKLPRPDVVGFLLVVDVFTREAWAAIIHNKTAEETLRAFRACVPLPLPKQISITTDLGAEFQGAFATWCNAQGAILRVRSPGAKNDIAVCDRAMAKIKLELAKESKDRRTRDWVSFFDQVIGFYNRTKHRAVHGFPKDVATDNVQHFLVKQDNVPKFKHNHELEQKRALKLFMEEPARFRPPVLPAHHNFEERIGAPRFGAVKEVGGIKSGVVMDKEGEEFPIKLVRHTNMAVRGARPTWRVLRRVEEPAPRRWASGSLQRPGGFGEKFREALEELLALSLSSMGMDPMDKGDPDFDELITNMGEAIAGGKLFSAEEMRALGLTADAEGVERLKTAVRARSNGDPRTLRELLRGKRWASGVIGVRRFASLAPGPGGVIDL